MLSAVVTCYFEERSIEEFYAKLAEALEETGRPYEIVMVNDGSTDCTFEKLCEIYDRDRNVTCVLDFFKNAGQLAAWTAAIQETRGDVILLIDSDLQLDPGELPRLLAKYDEGYDLVSGYRVNRKDSIGRIIPSKLANIIMRKVSETTLSDFGCTFKLYNAKVLRAFKLGPLNVFDTASVISSMGRYTEVPVTHHPRKYGKSGWTFAKLWRFNMNNIMNLSERYFQIIGFVLLLAALMGGLRVGFDYFVSFQILPDVSRGLLLNAIVISTVTLVGVLCLVGELALRNFLKLRLKPAYVIREAYRRTRGVAE